MAPELCGSVSLSVKYSSRIDVYSFGIILWEASAGVTPWSHKKFKFSHELLDCVKNGERPPISNVMKSNVPAGYFTMVRSCWHQEAKNRPTFRVVFELLCDMVLKASPSPIGHDGIELIQKKNEKEEKAAATKEDITTTMPSSISNQSDHNSSMYDEI